MQYITDRQIVVRDDHVYYDPWYIGRDMWGGRIVDSASYHEQKIPSYLGISTLIRVRHGYRANHRAVGHCGRSDVWLCVTEE